MKRLIFVTGRPGIGKSSVLLRAVDGPKLKGYKIGGMISHEVREKGIRVGFEIIDFSSGRKGWLAHINQPVGPKVSKYKVNLNDLDLVGAGSIQDAIRNSQIIIIDEIGPMELFSQSFREAVVEATDSGKPVLGTIHFKARDPLINLIRNRDDNEVIKVTYENRKDLHTDLIDKVVQSLKATSNNR
jgi:nucleoside-triphosphatase